MKFSSSALWPNTKWQSWREKKWNSPVCKIWWDFCCVSVHQKLAVFYMVVLTSCVRCDGDEQTWGKDMWELLWSLACLQLNVVAQLLAGVSQFIVVTLIFSLIGSSGFNLLCFIVSHICKGKCALPKLVLYWLKIWPRTKLFPHCLEILFWSEGGGKYEFTDIIENFDLQCAWSGRLHVFLNDGWLFPFLHPSVTLSITGKILYSAQNCKW